MTTVKELKAFLDQFPDDVEVKVLECDIGIDYGGETVRPVPFDCSEFGTHDFVDFTTNQFVKDDPDHPLYGRKILTLGVD